MDSKGGGAASPNISDKSPPKPTAPSFVDRAIGVFTTTRPKKRQKIERPNSDDQLLIEYQKWLTRMIDPDDYRKGGSVFCKERQNEIKIILELYPEDKSIDINEEAASKLKHHWWLTMTETMSTETLFNGLYKHYYEYDSDDEPILNRLSEWTINELMIYNFKNIKTLDMFTVTVDHNQFNGTLTLPLFPYENEFKENMLAVWSSDESFYNNVKFSFTQTRNFKAVATMDFSSLLIDEYPLKENLDHQAAIFEEMFRQNHQYFIDNIVTILQKRLPGPIFEEYYQRDKITLNFKPDNISRTEVEILIDLKQNEN